MPTLVTNIATATATVAEHSGPIEVEVERRDALLIAHFNSSQQRSIAVFLPPHADVKLEKLRLANAFEALPKLLTLNAVMARKLTFDGRPGEEWLSEEPLPEDLVYYERREPKAPTGYASLEVDKERRLRSEGFLGR